MSALVERFRTNYAHYRSTSFDETSTRNNFINPFFEALGWDVADVNGRGPARDVIVETRVASSTSVAGSEEWDDDLSIDDLAARDPITSIPDYTFRVEGSVKFLTEAKKPSVNIRLKAPAFQVKSYAWTMGVPIAVLTDFEELRVFDATLQPEYDAPTTGLLAELDLGFDDYVASWDRIWDVLSREAVVGGSLDRLALATRRRARGYAPVDTVFLRELEAWRLDLAQDLAAQNVDLDRWQLAEATQRILNRVVFVRVLEDREIEGPNVLRRYARLPNSYRQATREFDRLDAIYNGQLFAEHFSQRLAVSDGVFQRLIESLYFPYSPYRFDAIGPDLLGSIYERFLGSTLLLEDDGTVSVSEKPDVRHAGGVYYTPAWVVDEIVRDTLGPLTDGKSVRAIQSLRVLDPACGSGAFLIQAFDYLVERHADYFDDHPTENARSHFLDPTGKRRLTADFKASILEKCIFGVDIDPQAVEVTQMSLYLKLLEHENFSSLASHQAAFRGQKYLPKLDRNIRSGNSLISTVDVTRDVLFGDEEIRRRVNPFNWRDDDDGFGHVFRERGGFDAVIGNPPYTRMQELRRYRPEETDVYQAKFETASSGSFDIASLFVEQGLDLLRSTRNSAGRLGFIITRGFLETDAGRPLRHLLARRQAVIDIVDFRAGRVFPEAGAYTLILVVSAAAQTTFQLTRVTEQPSAASVARARSDSTRTAPRHNSVLTADEWDLLLPGEEALLDRLGQSFRTLGDVVGGTIFQAVVTGADYVYRLLDIGPGSQAGLRRVAHRATGEEVEIEAELLRPVLAGRSDIQRFRVNKSAEWLLLPYERDGADTIYSLIPKTRLRSAFPLTWDWFSRHEGELRGRASGTWSDTNWYGYSRRQNLERFEEDKVLVPYMVKELCAYVDRESSYFVNVSTGGYGLPLAELEDGEFVAALLSSRLLSRVLSLRSRAWRGDWFAARRGNLVRLPIAEPTAGERQEVKSLFKDCVVATDQLARATSDYERGLARRVLRQTVEAFDRSVEALYEVSPHERRVIYDLAPPTPVDDEDGVE